MALSRLIIGFCLLAFMGFAQSKPENVGTAINSEYSELNPVVAPDGKTLYFGRKSHPANKYGTQGSESVAGSQDIWYSERVGDVWSSARRMPDVLNRDQYNTILSVSPDGQTILVKGSYVQGVYESRGFSMAKKVPGGWSIPEKINIPAYDRLSKGKNEYAYLSMDGNTLLLAFSEKRNSDWDDLFVSFLQQGQWSKPANLGSDINTEFSETTPFLAADGKTLYFSSDRPGGQGSHDIYMSKRLDNAWTSWRKPVNIGPPVNTDAYDAYYSLAAKGDYAYFLSSNGGAGKKDIFRIKIEQDITPPEVVKEAPLVAQDVKASSPRVITSETTEPVVLVSGKVKQPKTGLVPPGISVTYEDLKTGKIIGMATPDPVTGQYKLVLPYGFNYGITAKATGYLPNSTNLDLSQLRGRYLELDDRDLELMPIEKGSKVTINNLFFELNKATLTPESEPELKRMVQVMQENTALRIEISGHTDNTGTVAINEKLSQARADAVRNYLLAAGILANRIQAKGYGSSQPKVSNDTEEGRQQNRRVEFAIL